MPFATYTDLQTSISTWLDRPDLAAFIPDYIALFEAAFNIEAGAVRTQFNRTSVPVTLTINQNFMTLPADYLSTDSLILQQNGGRLVPLTPYAGATALYTQYPNAQASPQQSQGYINLASKIELAPTPDYAYGVMHYYYQRVPPLASNATNWLLTNYPMIYLYGSLLQAEAFLGDDPRLQVWGTLYDNMVQRLQGATDRNKYGGAALSVKVDAVA